ncbi:MAG: MBL fold metallo-hydrolase [Bacteroidales bacterium]|jgi:glyoxylase-like metal-dependent hydrolase (beta-lactamase superfamily II)|nr:MBL fold metallo-hydrolase [Bacteroidales bacterium]
MMTQIQIFHFNDLEVNTYVIWDETKECVIIDAGCVRDYECRELTDFIAKADLKPVYLLTTHYHIDHIMGNKFVKETYRIPVCAHAAGEIFWKRGDMWAYSFGVNKNDLIAPDSFLKDNDIITFGVSRLKVLYTPGHADGSVCFYNEKEGYVVVGDVLFYSSIGRTDLPSGNFDTIKKSIYEKLYILPDETIIYPGHGPKTTVGFEKEHNPFL